MSTSRSRVRRRRLWRAPSDEFRLFLHRDSDCAGLRRCSLLLGGAHSGPSLALLRASVGEARRELSDPVHPGHPGRSGRRGGTRRRLDVRPVRVVPPPHAKSGGADAAAAEPRSFLKVLDEVSEAMESGSGLPAVARAAGRALDASVIVLDVASSVLAVACRSSEDERVVMAGGGGGGGGGGEGGGGPPRRGGVPP